MFAVLASAFACGDATDEDNGGSGAAQTTTGNSTTASSMSTGSPTSSGTGGNVMCTGMYTSADTTPCDPLQPGTCMAGTHCTFVDNVGTLGCVPDNAGVKVLGDPCTDSSECSGVYECIGNTCSTWCCPDNNLPCTTASGLCDVQVTAPDDDTKWVMGCSFQPACTLLGNTCAMGTYCHPADLAAAVAVCETPSGPMAPFAEGAPCMYRNDCGESAFCDNNAMPAVCRQICDVTNWMTLQVPLGGCPAMRTCMSVNWGNNQWTNFGLCMP